jgi:hypothetical protein
MVSSYDEFRSAAPVRSWVAVGRRMRRIERDLACSDPEFTRLFAVVARPVRTSAGKGERIRMAKRFLARLALSTAYSLDPAACAFRNSQRSTGELQKGI